MKQSFSRSRWFKLSGFTLVELLVVIGIIGILAAILMTVIGSALRAAKRAKAATTASSIQTATLNYYTEYSVYPVPASTTGDYLITDVAASYPAWESLTYCLSGNLSPSTGKTTPTPATLIANTRGIAFLSLKISDVDATDAPLNPLPTGNAIYFNIAINNSYSGVLGTVAPTLNAMPNFAKSTTTLMDMTGTSTAGVAVWANCNGNTSTTNPNYYVHTY